MAGAAPRVERETVVGEAEVLQVFPLQAKRSGEGGASAVAGCRVTEGSIRAAAAFRVLRAGVEVRSAACSLQASAHPCIGACLFCSRHLKTAWPVRH